MSDPDATPRDWWEQEQEAMLDDWIRRYAEERFVADGDGEERRRVPNNPDQCKAHPEHSQTTITDRLSGRKA